MEDSQLIPPIRPIVFIFFLEEKPFCYASAERRPQGCSSRAGLPSTLSFSKVWVYVVLGCVFACMRLLFSIQLDMSEENGFPSAGSVYRIRVNAVAPSARWGFGTATESDNT